MSPPPANDIYKAKGRKYTDLTRHHRDRGVGLANVRQRIRPSNNDPPFQKLFQILDWNDDGKFTITPQSFGFLDANRDRFLSKQELFKRVVLENPGLTGADFRQLKSVYDILDNNNDGRIDVVEFLNSKKFLAVRTKIRIAHLKQTKGWFTASIRKGQGYTLREMLSAGYSQVQLLSAGFTLAQIWDA